MIPVLKANVAICAGLYTEGPDGTPLAPVDPENPSAGYCAGTIQRMHGDDTVIHYVANDKQRELRILMMILALNWRS